MSEGEAILTNRFDGLIEKTLFQTNITLIRASEQPPSMSEASFENSKKMLKDFLKFVLDETEKNYE